MPSDRLSQWLGQLGYTAEADALHRKGDTIPASHSYALEMQALLRPDGAIRAEAVYDVEGVPTVVFVSERDGHVLSREELDGIRQRLWNQNLVSVVIAIEGDRARAMPVRRLNGAESVLQLDSARPDGAFSAAEVWSSELSHRLPKWFDAKARVDRKLLDNLVEAVRQLKEHGVPRETAQVLMGQVLFVSYLEHRGIVSDHYRQRRQVKPLRELVQAGDREGLLALIGWLREDFNGDFLSKPSEATRWDPLADALEPWREITPGALALLGRFLCRVDLASGQGSLWNYDFSFIPVELLSGLYESFLTAEQQNEDGAYYTPRHLATLTVDQAFAASPNPLAERIFDGTCGSGILLTTAYRKLIALTEAKLKRRLGFVERRELLLRQIFGGDINPMACRVTAFSLYLSLLEGLAPADVLAAQEREGAKLPSLRGSNLCAGRGADFFSDDHPFFGQRFTLIISNPAWKEASGDTTSADAWAQRTHAPFVRRQLAGAYSLRALDFLAEGGRLCLILPITQLLGATSQRYVEFLFDRVCPVSVTNFGDFQQLLFASAANTCHVLVATRRPKDQIGRVAFTETFDYCVPKAELSLAFGRLSVQSADRHRLQTQSIQRDAQQLVLLMWGDATDRALLARLQMHGTFKDLWTGRHRRWRNRKGVHPADATREAVDPGSLREIPHVSIDALRRGVPVLHTKVLATWPDALTTIVGLNDELRSVFDGPRVLFPDGFSRQELNVRASYFDGPASFTHSIGVITGPREDEDLLRFTAVYLRSSMAKYFLMLTCAKMLTERNGVHLTDIEPFPFFMPGDAPQPEQATAALQHVAAWSRALEALPADDQRSAYMRDVHEIDERVFDYFGLDAVERTIVRETVTVLLPSVRPRSYKSLYTPRQHPVQVADLDSYARSLADALARWRDRMGGTGRFHVTVVANRPGWSGGMGVVKVQYLTDATRSSQISTHIDTALVEQTVRALQREELDRPVGPGGISGLLDQRLWTPRGLYLVRPLVRRAWLTRTALRDAEQIVRDVQQAAPAEREVA